MPCLPAAIAAGKHLDGPRLNAYGADTLAVLVDSDTGTV